MNKKYRLRKNYEFNYVYRKGNSAASREMVLYSARNRDGGIKIGVTAGKKVGGSVQRSRAKRLMREAFMGVITETKTGYNYIVVGRSDILNSNFEQIKKSLRYMLKKIDRLEVAK